MKTTVEEYHHILHGSLARARELVKDHPNFEQMDKAMDVMEDILDRAWLAVLKREQEAS